MNGVSTVIVVLKLPKDTSKVLFSNTLVQHQPNIMV